MSEAHARPPHGPVLRGDIVDGEKVIGFAYVADGIGDRLLVEGDEEFAEPPGRPVPGDGADADRLGASPAAGAAQTKPAPAHLRNWVDHRIMALGVGGKVIWALLESLQAASHEVWLVGGAVRDPLLDGPAADPGDLDFTGTAGPGLLSALHRRTRRRRGFADYTPNVSFRLVWSLATVEPPHERIMEYRPLDLPGLRFPAFGGDLATDARSRDLTVNALYYDLSRDEIVDPLGVALPHLHAMPRKLVVLDRRGDPLVSASILLRCLKFWRRWESVDLLDVQEWARGLPKELPALVPEGGWRMLQRLREQAGLPDLDPETELTFAGSLAPIAAGIIHELQRRSPSGS